MRETLVSVEVEGWRETVAALRALEPRIRATATAELEAVAREAASEAASRIHRVTGASAAGYRVSVQQRGVAIANRARGAAIVEFAGRLHPQGRTPRGRTLIATLNARYGPPARLAEPAVLSRRQRLEAAMEAAVEAVARELGFGGG
jgi:hypothetical protein